jgi:hypothetical protein
MLNHNDALNFKTQERETNSSLAGLGPHKAGQARKHPMAGQLAKAHTFRFMT